MNKEILNRAFTKSEIFEYKCPHCYLAILRPDGEFRSVETEASKAEHHEEWWEPEMVQLTFSLTLKCTNCHELVLVVGRGTVEEEVFINHEGQWDRNYVEYFTPTYFHPPLQLIDYPSGFSGEVEVVLSKACELFFSSPAACCNNVRIAGELILNYLDVPAERKGRRISFGDRIFLIEDDKKSIRELFHALKFLGNHGSHPGSEIVHEDAIHALEITEFILEEVYGTRRAEIQKLAQAINKQKGPLGRLYKWILKKNL